MKPVRLIIAGSRSIYGLPGMEALEEAVEKAGYAKSTEIKHVLCGGARGVDELGKAWAEHYGIPVYEFPANWDRYKKSAGIIRNIQMVEHADALLAVWDGVSNGTRHVIGEAKKQGLRVYVHEVPILHKDTFT